MDITDRQAWTVKRWFKRVLERPYWRKKQDCFSYRWRETRNYSMRLTLSRQIIVTKRERIQSRTLPSAQGWIFCEAKYHRKSLTIPKRQDWPKGAGNYYSLPLDCIKSYSSLVWILVLRIWNIPSLSDSIRYDGTITKHFSNDYLKPTTLGAIIGDIWGAVLHFSISRKCGTALGSTAHGCSCLPGQTGYFRHRS